MKKNDPTWSPDNGADRAAEDPRAESRREVEEALSQRTRWEERQKTWYQMRHHGLRRKQKPHPHAADLHFPLADTNISKLKPFYYQQIYASELLAGFTAREPAAEELSNEAARWFHWQLTENTNHEEETLIADDHMLQSGRGIVKVYWDAAKAKLCFEAVDPVYFIVPPQTKDLQEADWVCHVKHYSPAGYKRQSNYRKDPEFVKSITGRGDEDDKGKRAEEQTREGLTHGAENVIVIWEKMTKQADGRVRVETWSPVRPQDPVREDFFLPYIDGKKPDGTTLTDYPFVDFPYEITTGDWYSPRGVTELVAAFEASACKVWNEKHDALTFYNRPIFSNRGNRPFQAGNAKMVPGEIIDADIQSVSHGQPPVSWDQEMVNIRSVAENRIQIPDFGMGQQQAHRDAKTATEIARLSSLMDVGIDMRANLHRKRLARKYRLAWNRLRQYAGRDLVYHWQENLGQLPTEALAIKWEIRPSGSADSWNKALQQQKAYALWTMFANDPMIDQGGLRQILLESLDPRYVSRLLIDPAVKAATEAEQQALQLLLMLSGWPAQPLPHEDHAARIPVIIGKLEELGATGQPVEPRARELIHQHLAARLEMLRQKDPAAAREITQALRQMEQAAPAPQGGTGVIPFNERGMP